ncbi:MAG: hypothetical protein Q8R36_00115 [bacterium]|nr:hypothetical protein [bacterium]
MIPLHWFRKEIKKGKQPMYRLEYQQPYEYDDGDSAGGHEILWCTNTHNLEASTDAEARSEAYRFLMEGAIYFMDKTFKRNGLRLIFTETREVLNSNELSHDQIWA